jgi:peptide/nickel transport system substrate-binding protein
MVLGLGYTADAEGNPVSWNETRWVDEEFNTLLEQANGTYDVEERRKIFCKLEDIQMTRGSIGIPFWRNVWMVMRKRVQGAKPHPNLYMLFNDVWLEQA